MFQLSLSIGTAFLEILFLDGAVVGWPSLQYVLQKEGYFEYLCESDSFNFTQTNISTTVSPQNNILNSTQRNVSITKSLEKDCPEQESSFNLVYTLWLSALFLCSFPVGWLFDRLASTWIYRCIASACFTLSFLLLTVSGPATSVLLYPSMIIMAMSGYALLVSNYQLANLAKSGRNATITAMNGVMDSAVIVFLLIKKGYDNNTNLYTIFQIFTLLTLFIWARTFILMPQKVIYYPLTAQSTIYGWKEWICFKKREELRPTREMETVSGGVASNEKPKNSIEVIESQDEIHEKVPFTSCLKNKLIWTSIFHLSALNLRLSIFYGAVTQWLEGIGESDEKISQLIDDLGIILIFAVCVAPLNGLLVDLVTRYVQDENKKVCDLMGSFASMLASSSLGILMSVMTLIPSIYGSFICHLFVTGFVFGGGVAFVMVHFPSEHLGKLIGIQFTCVGVINLLQYALFAISIAVDPTFFYINIAMLLLCFLTLIHPIAIWLEARNLNFD